MSLLKKDSKRITVGDKMRYLITVDGVDCVGKSTFIDVLIPTIYEYLASRIDNEFEVAFASPFGVCKSHVNQRNSVQNKERKVLKNYIDKIISGRLSTNKDSFDNEILKGLFWLVNTDLIDECLSQNINKDKKYIYVIDRSYITYFIHQFGSCTAGFNLIKLIENSYDASIILTDDDERIKNRMIKRKKKDCMDKTDTIPYLNSEFSSMNEIFPNSKYDLYVYNIGMYKNDNYLDTYKKISKNFLEKIIL